MAILIKQFKIITIIITMKYNKINILLEKK